MWLLALAVGHADWRQRLAVDSAGGVGTVEADGGLSLPLSRYVPDHPRVATPARTGPGPGPGREDAFAALLDVQDMAAPPDAAPARPGPEWVFPLSCVALAALGAAGAWTASVAREPLRVSRRPSVDAAQGTRDRWCVYAVGMMDLFLLVAACAAPITECYSLMLDQGRGAVASGWLLGTPAGIKGWTGVLLLFCMRPWHQPLARALILSGALGRALALLMYALFAWPPAWLPWQSADARFAGCLAARVLLGVCCFSSALSKTMCAKVAPPSDRITVGVMIMCSVTLGIGGGPLLTSAVNLVFVPGTVQGRSALPMVVLAMLHVLLAAASLALPKDLAPALALALRGTSQLTGPSDPELRKVIWIKALWYGLERALVVSAVEAATALILITEFEWRTQTAGVAVSITFLGGLPLSLAVLCSKSRRMWDEDLSIARRAGLASFLAAFLFYTPAGALFTPSGKVVLVLAADSLIFLSGYLASGIMDGLAFQCAEETGFFTIEVYCVLSNLLQDSVGRFLAPPIARYLLSYYGRDLYATGQMLITMVGLCSLLMIRPERPICAKVEDDLTSEGKASSVEDIEPEGEPEQDRQDDSTSAG